MPRAFLDSSRARIRPCPGVPPGGRPRKRDCFVAIGRRRLRFSAAPSGCFPLEHRGRTARKRRPSSNTCDILVLQPFAGIAGLPSRCTHLYLHAIGSRYHAFDFQPAAILSVGWRTDCSVPSLVCFWAGEQSDNRQHFWDYWHRRVWIIRADPVICGKRGLGGLGWRRWRVHGVQLLARLPISNHIVQIGEIAASSRVCLPDLPRTAAGGRLLAMRPMPRGV